MIGMQAASGRELKLELGWLNVPVLGYPDDGAAAGKEKAALLVDGTELGACAATLLAGPAGLRTIQANSSQ